MSDNDVWYSLVGVFKRYIGLETCLDMKRFYRCNFVDFLDEAFSIIRATGKGKRSGAAWMMNDGSRIENDDECLRVYRGEELIRAIAL